jgi:uncharacterized protein YjbI with pentapeptide repeats
MAMHRPGSPAGSKRIAGRSSWRGLLPTRGAGALLLLAAALFPLLPPPGAQAASGDDLIRLLQRKACAGCRLQDADLVQADLRDADLRNAHLQRANLSQARLDGAVLSGADLRFTSLQGASLRGADLRGAQLEGTDLRRSDLSAAQLDAGALDRSHWEGAIGIQPSQLNYAQLHNAGVKAAAEGRYPEAETFFSQAIQLQPQAPVSWAARGISRQELGQNQLAAQDLNHAAVLLEQGGDQKGAQDLRKAASGIVKPDAKPRNGNGFGGQVMQGAAAMAGALAPLAIKFLVPLAF